MLITASEDSTLKIWSLQKATQSMRNNRIVDLEPTHTFRGHTGAVMCVGVSEDGSCVYSGGVDTSIRSWKLPSDEVDPFDPYGELAACSVVPYSGLFSYGRIAKLFCAIGSSI